MAQVADGPRSAQSPWERQRGKITPRNQRSHDGGTRRRSGKWDLPVKAGPPKAPLKAVALPELREWDRRRLWSKIAVGPAGECWPWRAASGTVGYGRFKVQGKLYSPHRLVYAITNGPIADVNEHHGSVVMHTCDNPACCNPAHLRLGTQKANVADMFAKGRAHQCRDAATDVPSPALPFQGGVR